MRVRSRSDHRCDTGEPSPAHKLAPVNLLSYSSCRALAHIAFGAWAVMAAVSAPASAQGADCTALARRLPRLTFQSCEAAGLQPSGARSVKGFPLYQRDVPARTAAAEIKPAPRILVVGGVHGDELSSSSLVFHWIAMAAESPAEIAWRFVPAVNPDGILQPRPTRTNANGVDLNRNFPTPQWTADAQKWWVERARKDANRWPGPTAQSEPEVRFVVDTIERWKPDLVVSVHAPYSLLDYDGPSAPPRRLGRLFLDRLGVFPGSLGSYGGLHKRLPVVTIELPSAAFTPTDAEMRSMWADLLRWAGQYLAER